MKPTLLRYVSTKVQKIRVHVTIAHDQRQSSVDHNTHYKKSTGHAIEAVPITI